MLRAQGAGPCKLKPSPRGFTREQVAQAFVGLFRLFQHIHQGLVLAARDHEQALLQQGLLGGQTGALQNEFGQ